MPATLAIPTRRPLPRRRMGSMNGWKVAAVPVLLVANRRAITSRSSRTALSMPMLMPALAITTSGTPRVARQSCAALTMLSVSATSAASTLQRVASSPRSCAQARMGSTRRATRARRQPASA